MKPFLKQKKRILRSAAYMLFLITLLCLFPLAAEASNYYFPPDEDGKLVIVLDPGHGGENLGADHNGFLEKKMTMTVANAMYEELSKYDGITVYMTHTEDVDMSLQERADYAASVDADFLFCLHFNMSPSNSLFGSEVWISAFEDENREGYRFGSVQMDTMKEMGLYIRGVKTKFHSKGNDYYGILRGCTEYGIPSALIEHCHVDNVNDTGFCDSEEDLIAFGKADATSVARYFGLSSQALGVSYSDYADIPSVEAGKVYMQPDTTQPDICYLYAQDCDYETGQVKVTLTAQDYNTPMLYYSYSIDNGVSWTEFYPWPDCDIMGGYSPDTFSFTIQIPSGTQPEIIARAYNQYDLYAESNSLTDYQVFDYGREETAPSSGEATDSSATPSDVPAGADDILTVPSSGREENTEETQVSFLFFLKLCLVCVSILFLVVLITKIITSSRRRKRRHTKR